MGKIVIDFLKDLLQEKKTRTVAHKISRSAEAGKVGQIIPQLTFWWSDSETNKVKLFCHFTEYEKPTVNQ